MKGFCGECDRRYACDIDPDKCDEWPDPVPATNADRIRAMSDEELAKWLVEFANEAFAAGLIGFSVAMMDEQLRLAWLQYPAGEETA